VPTVPNDADPTASSGRILLVLPLDNRTGQPNLEWVREASAEVLSRRLAAAGFAPMSRVDRLYALDHLGLPQGFHPSRATSLKLAETLDADSIVVGSYVTDGSGILAEARLVDVAHLRMGPPVTARGEMRDLIAIFGSLAWKLTRQLEPGFSGSEDTFVAASAGLTPSSSTSAASASPISRSAFAISTRLSLSALSFLPPGWLSVARTTPASSMNWPPRLLPR
jgi:TolB-like protein